MRVGRPSSVNALDPTSPAKGRIGGALLTGLLNSEGGCNLKPNACPVQRNAKRPFALRIEKSRRLNDAAASSGRIELQPEFWIGRGGNVEAF